ncbi:hypothetical protein V6N13_053572 [Hibiscus sabdariffa]
MRDFHNRYSDWHGRVLSHRSSHYRGHGVRDRTMGFGGVKVSGRASEAEGRRLAHQGKPMRKLKGNDQQ